MTLFYEYSYYFTQCGFVTTSIANTLFIYLTILHIKKITGPYKVMVLVFSFVGIFFATWELVSRPFAHNYNKALMYFSLNSWLEESPEFLRIAICIYAALYIVILAIIAVQFLFRYFTLCRPNFSRKFGGAGVMVWMFYVLLSGAIYGGAMYVYCDPDEFSDSYMRDIISDTYELNITNVPRYVIVPYSEDGSIRWRIIKFLLSGVATIALQYLIIIYCGVRMHTVLQKELAQQSVVNRKLQKQFFRALVVQTIVPTLLFVLPIAPFLIGPLIQPFFLFEMNFQTGWMYVILCLYPPIDTIAFMLIVSEYKKATLEMFKPVLPKTIKVTSEISTSTAAAVTR